MKKKTKAILCAASIIGVVGISGILAYLTDSDSAINKFTVGNVDIDLVEEQWDEADDENKNGIPDYAEDIAPGTTIVKDPKVKNVGETDAYIFLKVKVPADKVVTVNADGTRKNDGAEVDTPLFTYTTNSGWAKIASADEVETDTDDNVLSYTYVYYYEDAIGKNEETSTLFDNVTFANIIEGYEEGAEKQIDIEAYAIQKDNLPEGTTIPQAYSIYVSQKTLSK